jgi:hypothetical protein
MQSVENIYWYYGVLTYLEFSGIWYCYRGGEEEERNIDIEY